MANARDTILNALKQGAPGPGISFDPVPDPLPESFREPSEDWESFAAAIAPLNGELVLAHGPEEFAARLQAVLEELGATSAVCWEHPLLQELDLSGKLRRCGVQELQVRADEPDAPAGGELTEGQRFCPKLAEVDLGITAADAVFTFAGTIVVKAGEGQPRSVSLAPPVHLAIVAQSVLCRDLSSLPALLREHMAATGSMPSGLHMITGASSTADIEQTLVRGVHGPGQVRVIGVTWL